MDNAANYKATGRILHDKYPHIYWSLCATQIDGNRSKFLNEANLYRGKVGEFCKQLAIDSIKHMHPNMWWNTFRHSVPNTQKWAIRILSQTASSSGCERNYSVFERIHTKKRNKLDHQRAFNKNGTYDPMDYERIDDIEFWIMEEDTNSTPILDTNEIESVLYNEELILIVGLDNKEGELAPTIGLEKGRLNLDSFPQEDVNSYSGADDDGFPSV
ncbi:hAT dimerization domain-containing protein / transposase protein [Trifolium repens]|nr:hAT dimerization domain-containing protein / transposase protein [Trifolium repens]